jgi:hypothetical protein
MNCAGIKFSICNGKCVRGPDINDLQYEISEVAGCVCKQWEVPNVGRREL